MPQLPFGPYTLVRRLAVGGMAEVYLATLAGPRGFEKKVVVKQILPQLAREPELLQLFFDEAAIAQKLAHPGIVQVFDVGQHDGTHYIAMEYVDGLDLDDLIRRQFRAEGRGLPVPLAVRVVHDLARAVHYAHEATDEHGRALDVIHRDISPQNVLLGRDGAVKLGDFGIARTNLRARHTQTGVLRGKISYLAPERFAGERASRGVDVYAMGVVLYECIAGKRPFQGDDAALIKKILHETPPPLSAILPDVDPRLDALVSSAMARDLAARLPTARALADGLAALGATAALAELGAFVTKMADRGPAEMSAKPHRPTPARSTETLPGRLDDPELLPPREAALRAETAAAEPPQVSEPRAVVVRAATIGVGEAIVPLDPAQVLEETSGLPAPAVLAPPADPTRALPVSDVDATRVDPPPRRPRPRSTSVIVDTARRWPVAAVAVVCAMGLLVGTVVTQLWAARAPAPATTPLPEGDADPAALGARAAVLAPADDPEPAHTSALDPVPVPTDDAPPRVEPEAIRVPVADDEESPKKARRPRKTPRPRATAAGPAAEVGEGELSIDAEPWAYVIVDGRSLGPTPLAHVRLPAGTHRLRLENPEQGLARNLPVVIKADQRTALRIRLTP